jgi:2-polyprenyl-6-methoxyphenol hydroxylase-like FAD-dependent oxidoreductase
LAQGVIYNHVRVYRGATLWATAPLTAAPIRHGYNIMLGLPQDQTEAILRDRFTALGGMIAYGVELSGIRQDQHGVIAETTDGGEWPADYLIGADGIRSAARPAIGIAANGVDLPDTWSIADADADWPHKHDATLCLMDQRQMAAIIPLGADRFRFISNTDSALAALPLQVDISNIRREAQFKITLSRVDTYQNGRVFLAGDSAHSQSPAGGRGMNLGIADSADLAHRLAHGDLQTYSAARHAEGKKVMAGAEQMRKIVTSANPAVRALTFAGLKAVSALPPLQRMFASNFLYG